MKKLKQIPFGYLSMGNTLKDIIRNHYLEDVNASLGNDLWRKIYYSLERKLKKLGYVQYDV